MLLVTAYSNVRYSEHVKTLPFHPNPMPWLYLFYCPFIKTDEIAYFRAVHVALKC